MQTQRVEVTTGEQSLAEVKIQRCIFQGDALSPLLFVMDINHLRWKFTAGYKLSKSQEKINHLMYMDDINLFARNEKELEIPTTNCKNISSRYRNRIWYRKMCHIRNEK